MANSPLIGWIKIDRKMMAWEWYDEPLVVRLFTHCIMRANYSDAEWKGEPIDRGSFVTSYEKLKVQTGLSVQQIRTALKKLESTQDINRTSTSFGTLITVVNYNKYQYTEENQQQINTQSNSAATRRATTDQHAEQQQYKNTRIQENKNTRSKKLRRTGAQGEQSKKNKKGKNGETEKGKENEMRDEEKSIPKQPIEKEKEKLSSQKEKEESNEAAESPSISNDQGQSGTQTQINKRKSLTDAENGSDEFGVPIGDDELREYARAWQDVYAEVYDGADFMFTPDTLNNLKWVRKWTKRRLNQSKKDEGDYLSKVTIEEQVDAFRWFLECLPTWVTEDDYFNLPFISNRMDHLYQKIKKGLKNGSNRKAEEYHDHLVEKIIDGTATEEEKRFLNVD